MHSLLLDLRRCLLQIPNGEVRVQTGMLNQSRINIKSDLIAALAETTAGPSLPRLLDRMLESPEGRQILKERPRVNSTTVDMNELARCPEGTFGRSYVTWLERCGVTPDTREPVCPNLCVRKRVRLQKIRLDRYTISLILSWHMSCNVTASATTSTIAS